MKPDIIKWNCLRWIDGHVGVFCSCGRMLYIKNIPTKARQNVEIDCPCGETIRTIYTRYSHNRYQVSRFHRIVMHAKPGEIVDHIDKNRKDNRKRNLRRCAFTENDRNRGLYSTNTSGVTGVFYDKERGMWLANISYNGKRVYIGRYKFKEDAIQARLEKEIELFGEYAPQKALYETYQGRRSV